MGAEVQKVKIPFSVNGKTIEVREFACTYVGDYFAVLKAVDWHGQHKRRWQATHRPTGWRTGREYPTKKVAVEHAKRIEAHGKRLGVNLKTRSGAAMMRHPKFKALQKYGRKVYAELVRRPV